MHSFDFLSNSPRIFIFDRETNKTNFGGVLFLLYIIIMVLISLAYILDFALNDKYTIDATTYYNHTDNEEEIKKINDDEELNPYLELEIKTMDSNITVFNLIQNKFLEKNFMDEKGNSIIKYREKVSNIYLFILWPCGEDPNCSSYDEFFEHFKIELSRIDITYPGYKIEHLNDPPIHEDKPKNLIDFFLKKDVFMKFILIYGKLLNIKMKNHYSIHSQIEKLNIIMDI